MLDKSGPESAVAGESGERSISAAAAQVSSRNGFFGSRRNFHTNFTLTVMALPGLLFLLIFAYLPMFGIVIAFTDYRFADGIFGSEWVGFQNFRFLFGTDAAWRITRNTLVMNSLFIITSTSVSIAIAILMNEIYRSKMSKYYQTMLFFPYFISWVIASYFLFAFLNVENGIANQMLNRLGFDSISWYRSPQYWPLILVLANLWNSIGFGSIIYLAGILGIEPVYYEAAKIDGATKLQQIRSITLPMLLPLMIILVLLSIGRIFHADFGLFFFLPRDNPFLYSTTDVIDTFVYRSLVQLGDISMAAAAGFYQSVIGFGLVVLANWIVRRVNSEYSLW